VHWITTAVVIGAVVGAGALVQPADAGTAAHPARTARPGQGLHGRAARGDRPSAAPVDAPDAAAAHYPLNCAGAGVDVVSAVSGDLDGDGSPETVAVVRCHAGSGTPPSGMYVLSGPRTPGGRPVITQTLINPDSQRSVLALRLDGRAVKATVLGYSSDDVPRCCPDQSRPYTWVWRAGVFYAQPGPVSSPSAV
jgi:hypothetical protein